MFDFQFAIRRFSSGLNNQNVNIKIAHVTYVALFMQCSNAATNNYNDRLSTSRLSTAN